MRAAEYQAAQQRLHDAEAALQKAADTDARAQQTREVESQAAAAAAAEARQAEANYSQSRAAEDKAICDVSRPPRPVPSTLTSFLIAFCVLLRSVLQSMDPSPSWELDPQDRWLLVLLPPSRPEEAGSRPQEVGPTAATAMALGTCINDVP